MEDGRPWRRRVRLGSYDLRLLGLVEVLVLQGWLLVLLEVSGGGGRCREQELREDVGRGADRYAGRAWDGGGGGRGRRRGGFGHGVISRLRSGVNPLGATAERQLLVIARAGCFGGHLGRVVETVAGWKRHRSCSRWALKEKTPRDWFSSVPRRGGLKGPTAISC